jgi:hypothetical protein
MAEGLLGGILGDEEEKPEVESAETLASAEAFAAAVAARLSASDPEVDHVDASELRERAFDNLADRRCVGHVEHFGSKGFVITLEQGGDLAERIPSNGVPRIPRS